MKNKLLVMCMLLMPFITPSQSSASPHEIVLHAGYIDPVSGTNPNSKAPIRIPSLYTDDSMLCFNGAWQGYTIMLYENGELVYCGIVQGDCLDMHSVINNPDSDIEIVLENGNIRFYGILND